MDCHLQRDPDSMSYRPEARGDEESALARHQACKRPRRAQECCAVRAGQEQLVVSRSVGDDLERIRDISNSTEPKPVGFRRQANTDPDHYRLGLLHKDGYPTYANSPSDYEQCGNT